MANRVYISVLDPIWENVKQEHLIRVLSVQDLLIFGRRRGVMVTAHKSPYSEGILTETKYNFVFEFQKKQDQTNPYLDLL